VTGLASQSTSAILLWSAATLLLSYLSGSIPFAYIIVKTVTGEDVTTHGTGNVGSMNVRRTTGSWAWFVVAVLGDMAKGLIPVALAKAASSLPVIAPYGVSIQAAALQAGTSAGPAAMLLYPLPPIAVLGVVLGHNYSFWMALIKHKFTRTGKGLATGAGALLAYDWRYFLAVVIVGLSVIAITRYMMAGQVAAAVTLPVAALWLNSPDWPFMLFMGGLVYAAHHKRFVGMLKGNEPKLYINDRMGPRG
jgi:acyl phosphate:glycerol-3-phosphate acyltransferase